MKKQTNSIPSRRGYIVASIAGLIIGLFALINAACCPAIFAGEITGASQWAIPHWDSHLLSAPAIRDLEHQAVLLRMAKLLLENGFWFLILPPVLAGGLYQLSQGGKFQRCMALCICVMLCTGLSIYLLGFGISGIDNLTDWADPESVLVQASAMGWAIGIVTAFLLARTTVLTVSFLALILWGIVGPSLSRPALFKALMVTCVPGLILCLWQPPRLFQSGLLAQHNNRALAYNRLGQYKEAIADCNQVMKLAPHSGSPYGTRAYAYLGLGDFRAAISDLDKAICFNARDAASYANRALAYSELKQHANAIADWSKAISLDGATASDYRNRAYDYNQLAQYLKAMADANKAIGLEPHSAASYSNLAFAQCGFGLYQHAIAAANTSIRLDGNNASAYRTLGRAYQGIGYSHQAVAEFDKAVHIDPGYAKAYYNRSEAYEKLGELALACKDREKAKQLGCSVDHL